MSGVLLKWNDEWYVSSLSEWEDGVYWILKVNRHPCTGVLKSVAWQCQTKCKMSYTLCNYFKCWCSIVTEVHISKLHCWECHFKSSLDSTFFYLLFCFVFALTVTCCGRTECPNIQAQHTNHVSHKIVVKSSSMGQCIKCWKWGTSLTKAFRGCLA